MNILIVTETYLPYITGVSVSTDNIAHFLASKGHKVTLICPKPIAKGKVSPRKDFKVIYTPAFPFSFYNLNSTAIFPLALLLVNKLIKKEKFDVIHIQEPGALGVAVQIIARKNKIPTLGSLHYIPEQVDRVIWGTVEPIFTPILNVYNNIIYNNYDQVMTVSNFFANYLKSINIKPKINIVSNGVDTKKFTPRPKGDSLRNKYGFSGKDFIFFYIGRLDRDKNVETLVRAMPKTNPNIKLLVVGKGREKVYLSALSKSLKVKNKIVWMDYVSNTEMINLYNAVDVFTIMSPYEGQSIVTLQALASGLPVIAAKAGALPELVDERKNGYLVDTYDDFNLAKKMNLMAHTKSLRTKFGHQSRKIALKHERKVVFKKLEKIYTELIFRDHHLT